MSLRLITAPLVEPVSMETAKAFLRVDHTLEDALIASLITSAREQGEELARRAFITQTWEQVLDDWPPKDSLLVLRPPLQSVTSVKYYDTANAEHTWTDYVVDSRSDPGRIHFNSTPGTTLLESGGLVVQFVAGYGAAAQSVPARIQDLILALVAHWYENRESRNVPDDIKRAFINERTVWFPDA